MLRSRNEKDSAWYIHTLLKQRRRIGRNSGVLNSSRPREITNLKTNIIRMFPGVGTKLADALLQEFETIENIARARRTDLQRIPGLGKAKAARIDGALHEDDEEYCV